MHSTGTTLDYILERCQRLYSPPTVAARVLELTNSPSLDLRELRACIERDPALTAKLLRVVNSSLFGLSRQVADLGQALSHLGSGPLKMLVLGFSLSERLFAEINGEILGRYWRRTLIKALAARELARCQRRASSDEAFVAAILGDLGWLVLIQEYGQAYCRFLDLTLAQASQLAGLEFAALGFDHYTLGGALLRQWQLPEKLAKIVAAGTAEERIAALPPAQRELANILRLADQLAWALAEDRQDLWPGTISLAVREQRLGTVEFRQVVKTVQDQIDQLASALQLTLPPPAEYAALSQQALERLATLTSEEISRELRGKQLRALSDDELRAAEQTLVEVAARRQTANLEQPLAPPSPDHETTVEQSVLLPLIQSSLARCRMSRQPMSLLLCQFETRRGQGEHGAPCDDSDLRQLVWNAFGGLGCPPSAVLQLHESRFAILLPDCDRFTAARLAGELRQRLCLQPAPEDSLLLPAMHSLSLGLATASEIPRNLPSRELLTAAERCLQGSVLSGGNALKSIEV
ncbi:MAG: HDOD domain-containing protein [Pirellulales bacterium]|nr:HDOD domain-containing protein [Pirellulales bacterium]